MLDENYLIKHTLDSMDTSRLSSTEHENEIRSFQKFAWKTSKTHYNFLIGQSIPYDLSEKGLKEMMEELPAYFSILKDNEPYKNILSHTEEYLKYCEKQWEMNYITTSKMIFEITGLELDKTFTIYITHPSLKNGKYLGDNKIVWGHNEDWPNYSTIYIWHEILHSYFDTKQLDHVAISFVTDEELRIRLNGGKYPPFVTHEYLHPVMKKSLPIWKKYLKSRSKDIHDFKDQIKDL